MTATQHTPQTLLLIDTSGSACSATVAIAGQLGPIVSEPAERAHGERLFAVIERALAGAGFGIDRIEAVAVCTGPGGYAGLRAGIAAATGLAAGRGVPLVGVPRATMGADQPDAVPTDWAAFAAAARARMAAGETDARPLYARPPDAARPTYRPPSIIEAQGPRRRPVRDADRG